MAGFRIDLELAEGFAAVPEILNRAQRQLDLAAARALRKTAQWLRTHSTREIAKTLGIVQSPVRHRYNIFSQATGNQVKVWVGLQPISVHYLGNPKQTATGVAVGHRTYDDAFISQVKNGPAMVWRRKGRERLPLVRVTEDWEGPALDLLGRWEKRAQARFVELFEQEARYALKSSG
jgi:hypothetical protein